MQFSISYLQYYLQKITIESYCKKGDSKILALLVKSTFVALLPGLMAHANREYDFDDRA